MFDPEKSPGILLFFGKIKFPCFSRQFLVIRAAEGLHTVDLPEETGVDRACDGV